jgi:hypothetical protein
MTKYYTITEHVQPWAWGKRVVITNTVHFYLLVVVVVVGAWTDVAENVDRLLLSVVMNLQVSLNGRNCMTSWGTVSFSRRTASWRLW